MGDKTEAEMRFLDKLVGDCITFGLDPEESQKYVRIQYGKSVSQRTINRRKAYLESEDSSVKWLNHFTRIGFVQFHQEQLEDLKKLKADSYRRFFEESIKKGKDRNEYLIIKLKEDIRQTTALMNSFALGGPIIAGHYARLKRKRLDKIDQEDRELEKFKDK
jgi:hypothetical protein